MTFFVKMVAMEGFSLPDCRHNSLKAVIQFCFPKNCQITIGFSKKFENEILFYIIN
jgi:hypothetical protein